MLALVAISKGMQAVKLLEHNPPVLNWRCSQTQADCAKHTTVLCL